MSYSSLDISCWSNSAFFFAFQYRFYVDKPVYPFGFGLHYTNFTAEWSGSLPSTTQSTTALRSGLNITVALKNVGNMGSGESG